MPLQAHIRRALVVTPRAERIIRVSRGSLTVREGETATFDVWLSERPRTGQTVAVQVASTATGEATVNKSSLTFDENNFGTRQTVTVTGVADADARDENASVTLVATGGGYDDSTAVAVLVEDVTQKRLRVSDPSLSFDSTTLSRTIGVRLSSEPVGGDVTVAVSEDSDRFSVDESSLTFTAMNWNAQQIVTVSATAGANATGTLTLDPSGADYGSVASVTVALAFALTLPAVPTGLSLSASYYNANTQQRVRATWNAAARATSYEVRYKKSTETNWTTITGLTSTSYTANGADPNSTYDVQVQSRNASGPSGWSSTVQVTTGRQRGRFYVVGSYGYVRKYSGDGYEAGGSFDSGNVPVGSTGNKELVFDEQGDLYWTSDNVNNGIDLRYPIFKLSGGYPASRLTVGTFASYYEAILPPVTDHGCGRLAFDPTGNGYMMKRGRIYRMDGGFSTGGQWTNLMPGLSNFELSIAFDPQGNFYSTNPNGTMVRKMAGGASASGTWADHVSAPTEGQITRGLATIRFDVDGNLYGLSRDGGNFHRVYKYSNGSWDSGLDVPDHSTTSFAFD